MAREDIVCVIPARGGSKGIPGKNVIDFCGKPLLAWSIEAALTSGAVSRVIVSTEDEKIATVARQWGGEVPFMRPAELAQDHVHAVHTVLHVLDWLEAQGSEVPYGIMMLLPTSPLRLAEDVSGAVALFRRHGAPAVISVADLGKYMTNLRYLDGDALERVAPDEDPNAQRQELRKLYGVNGSIFLARPEVVRACGTFHADGALGYVMDTVRSIDVNSLADLDLARQLCSTLEPWKHMGRTP